MKPKMWPKEGQESFHEAEDGAKRGSRKLS